MFSHLFLVTVSKDLTFDDLHSSKEYWPGTMFIVASPHAYLQSPFPIVRKLAISHHTFTHSFIPSTLVVSELSSAPLWETTLSITVQCLCILLSLILQFLSQSILFQSYSRQAFSYPFLQWDCHIHFKTLVRFFYYSAFHFGIPQNPGWFLKFAYINFLCYTVQWILNM